ncbi:hypothetical protein [Primorskyibacter sp. 2E107]|uniref:hypothetical protein n=1 Tax=Primorskyibacter sp. 2E107 TaxID=3403458 RepID=UPI003AF82647
MYRLAAALALIASPVIADMVPGIQNHAVQVRFIHEPCAAVIAAIDTPPPGVIGVGEMAMTFGFLMGIEARNPGIRSSHETILIRLREDCAAMPDQTAMQMIEVYIAETAR